MSRAFDQCDAEATIQAVNDSEDRIYDHTPSEVRGLAFFKVCTRRELGLVGSW